ncbi:MAG: hypothetical protein AVDCRST_MAG33-309 [uncultured Thermomicrobiales bacterium]|uniref:Phosphatidic acid phosphatase type 2/haloperoxidase domain-containing protein n=1 Tax=uncultured Thermomicrobiales bacterium TaxID=1645740 RepID=A0A6J4UC61_9BACT|nr:MAG: hypothetical protein AVDCRST_MAG33-309 [uncultured Thermomicrobiales bacterium]
MSYQLMARERRVRMKHFSPHPDCWRRSHVTAGAVVGLALLAVLGAVAAGPGTVWWDESVQRALLAIDGSGWHAVATTGNWVGETPVSYGILAGTGLFLLVRHRFLEAALIGGVTLVRSLNWPIKWVFDSPRPATNDLGTNDIASGLGYPSGHAMSSMLVGGALLIVVFRLSRSRRVRTVAVVIVTSLILATGFGRVVSQAHWPSDVAGGWLTGGALLGIVAIAMSVIDQRRLRDRTGEPGDFPAATLLANPFSSRAVRRSR